MSVPKPRGVRVPLWFGQSQPHQQGLVAHVGTSPCVAPARAGCSKAPPKPQQISPQIHTWMHKHFWSHLDSGLHEGKCTVSSPGWLFGFSMHGLSFEDLGKLSEKAASWGSQNSEVVFPLQGFPSCVLSPCVPCPLVALCKFERWLEWCHWLNDAWS